MHDGVASPSQDGRNADVTAQLELRALERLLVALCRHVEALARNAKSRGILTCREGSLQFQAFEERRDRALDVLRSDRGEPCETRIARLQKHVEALDCSRVYFRTTALDMH